MTDKATTTPASGSAVKDCLAGLANPFVRGVVRSVWEADVVDVESIHREAFAALVGLVEERRQGIHGRAILLHGFAGSGKTHLLRRLRLHLETRTDPFIPFVWVWMQTAPGMKWRHLRREFVESLVRRLDGKSQLERLLELAAGDFERRLDRIADRNLQVVLEHLAQGRYLRDATAWLLGTPLPDAVAERLGIGQADVDDAVAEDQARRILEQLAAFIRPAPFVLCLDQLEQLQSYPGDKTGLFAVGELFAALDRIENAAVIGCVQTELQRELDGVLMQYARDRYRPVGLGELDQEQVRLLVRARLATEPRLRACRPPGAGEFWPVDPDRLAASPERLPRTPRWVLYACAEQFEAARESLLPAPSLEEFLRAEYEARLLEAGRKLAPETSSMILSDGLARLLHLRGGEIRREGLPRWLDHELRLPGGRRIGVTLAHERAQALWRKLARMREEWRPAEGALVVLIDVLHPVSSTARRTRELLEELEQRGARRLTPSREALAALDALRRLLGDVESGDLTHQGRTPELAAVEAWIRQNIPPALAELLDGIAGAEAVSRLASELADLLAERKVLSATEAAAALATTPEEVQRCARENRHHFGLLMGAEPVIFEKTPAGAGASLDDAARR
jgi:hypothetical protein